MFPNYPNSQALCILDFLIVELLFSMFSLKIISGTGNSVLTFTKLYKVFTMALRGSFGKIGNDGYQHFLLVSPQCFCSSRKL